MLPRLALVTVTALTIYALKSDAYDEQSTPRDYHPTAVGTKWVYRTGKDDLTRTLHASEKKDGALLITLVTESKDGKRSPSEKLLVTKNGIMRVEALGDKLDPPCMILKLPHMSKHSWECKSIRKHELSTIHYTAHDPEEVDTPAGKYMAIRVESELTVDSLGITAHSTDWYARGIGLIKSKYGESTMTLKEFKPVK